jgi:hypothetical protein
VDYALFEQAVLDIRSGAFVNCDLAEYLVPVHADIANLDAVLLDGFDDKPNVLGVKGIGELAIAHAQVEERGAAPGFHHSAVITGEYWNTHTARRFHYRGSNRVGIGRCLNKHRPAGSPAIRVRLTVPIFKATVDSQNGLLVPRIVARFRGEEIPVVLVASRPSDRIDAGAAAQDLAHRQRHAPAVQMWTWLGKEIPVALAGVIGGPTNCFPHLWDVVPSASLQQQYLDVRILGESARYD